ncbi:unnamed protein product [Brachionus calyciflorus]|uniref:Uncharacterized protein n=1 Tax=Brachionus calyciflorus TaxID=104777 RepID=A0A814SVS8_9BILA|nr:unnamed protein product [Brachionus calyciflorus]
MNKKKNFNKQLESVNIFSPLTTRSGKIRSLYSTDDIVASDNFYKNRNLTRSESMDFLCNVDFDKTIVVENNDLNEETFIIDKITDEVVGDFEEGEKSESDNDSIFLESDSSSHLIDFTYIDVEYDQYDRSKLLIVPTNKNKPKLCDHEYGLAKKENYKLEVYKDFQRLKVLPFVPPREIYIAFELIKKNSPLELNRMIEYFENYYIGK